MPNGHNTDGGNCTLFCKLDKTYIFIWFNKIFFFVYLKNIYLYVQSIHMMMLTILMFIICWMPVKIFQLMLEFSLISNCNQNQFYTMVYIYIVCHWLAMANSFINPIVYSFISKSFKVCLLFEVKKVKKSCDTDSNWLW